VGWNKRYAGKKIGQVLNNDGYWTISFVLDKKTRYFLSHRLAWLYVYGTFPDGPLDHVNRNKLDNRISNLREATCSLNSHNTGLNSKNKSGIKGVSWFKTTKKWQALIVWQRKTIFLGTFSNIEDAETAYKTASLKYAKEFSIYHEAA
jgi:hypothetical protein